MGQLVLQNHFKVQWRVFFHQHQHLPMEREIKSFPNNSLPTVPIVYLRNI